MSPRPAAEQSRPRRAGLLRAPGSAQRAAGAGLRAPGPGAAGGGRRGRAAARRAAAGKERPRGRGRGDNPGWCYRRIPFVIYRDRGRGGRGAGETALSGRDFCPLPAKTDSQQLPVHCSPLPRINGRRQTLMGETLFLP